MKKCYLTFVLAFIIALTWACAPSVQTESEESQPLDSFTTALFDPSASIIPFPNDLLISPTTGKVNIPNPGNLDAINSVNSLNGFSTTMPISFYLDGAPDSSTVNSSNIKLIDMTTGQQPMLSFMPFSASTGAQSMVPVKPLNSARRYLCVVTKGLTSGGKSVEPSAVFYLIKSANPLVDANGVPTSSLLNSYDEATVAQLEMLRQMMKPAFDFLGSIGISRDNIAIAFTFTTQDISGDLLTARDQVEALAATTPTTPLLDPTHKYLGDAMVGAFYAGVEAQTGVAFPHTNVGGVMFGAYLSPNFVSHPLAGYFVKGNDGKFIQQGTNTVPFILAVPKGTGPFPVVIFQHGLTRSKMDALAIADTFASQGLATIAIDMVLHGDRAGDYMDNTTGAMVPDGILDPSGSLIINLTSLRTSRDNLKQVALDQVQLVNMLAGGVDYTEDGLPDLAPAGFTYIGQSLGGITGTTFMAIEKDVKTAVLNVPGGMISKILTESIEISPAIFAGLAAMGVNPGTAEFSQFFLMVQTVVDSIDPINYAPHVLSGTLSGNEKYVLMQEAATGDPVVPNSTTELLAAAFGSNFKQINPIITSIYGLEAADAGTVTSGLYQFNSRNHGGLLSPFDSNNPGDAPCMECTVAEQTQAVTYLGYYLLTGTPMIIDPYASAKQIDNRFLKARDAAVDWAYTNTLFDCAINPKFAVYIN